MITLFFLFYLVFFKSQQKANLCAATDRIAMVPWRNVLNKWTRRVDWEVTECVRACMCVRIAKRMPFPLLCKSHSNEIARNMTVSLITKEKISCLLPSANYSFLISVQWAKDPTTHAKHFLCHSRFFAFRLEIRFFFPQNFPKRQISINRTVKEKQKNMLEFWRFWWW